MKTPIPEKINHIDVESNPFVSIILLAQLTGNLIDVLTEQQKENKTLTQRVSRLEKTVIRLQELYTHDSERIIKLEQPYTAMRSTGEIAYCECKGGPTSTNIHKNCYVCSKKIKPQEDVKKRLKTYLTNNIGLNNNLEYITDCILAIVKGE